MVRWRESREMGKQIEIFCNMRNMFYQSVTQAVSFAAVRVLRDEPSNGCEGDYGTSYSEKNSEFSQQESNL